MANLEPITYGNGALVLTDHGPRGGGIVLVHRLPDGHTKQVSIPYGSVALQYIESDATHISPACAFDLAVDTVGYR